MVFLGTVGTSVRSVQAATSDICKVTVVDSNGDAVKTVLKGDHVLALIRIQDDDDVPGALGVDIDADSGNADIVSEVMDTGGTDSTGADILNDVSQPATNTILNVQSFDVDDIGTGAGSLNINPVLDDYDISSIADDDADVCGTSTDDGFAAVDITCTKVGSFAVTAFSTSNPLNSLSSATINCFDLAATGTIKAVPTKVEIVPAAGSVDVSLITLTLKDSSGNDAFTDADQGFGDDVTWTTDNCQIQDVTIDENGDVSGDYEDLNDDFAAYANYPNPSTAAVVEGDVAGLDTMLMTTIDTLSSKQTLSNSSSSTDTISAVVLDCSNPTAAKPGPANVTAVFEGIDSSGNSSLQVVKVAVTVVGPPASVVATSDVTSVTCGDRATITVTVKDAIGQAVSDHTLVEAASNFGSVLAGTGAIAGQFGPVVPVASTGAETFNGVATFFLLTSNTQTGLYDVTVATGGGGAVADQLLGGVFSTPVVTAHVQVSCTQPAVAAAAPTVTAPRTGTGGVISPPNTGDAGLAATSTGSSWTLFVIAGAVAFALAGFAGLKFARR
jgi:hypothetical protein